MLVLLAVVPWLVTVTFFAELGLPTWRLPKSSD
jgi:hypothetical protein